MANPGSKRKRWAYVAGGVVVVGLVAWSMRPQPLRVEAAPAARGAMRVTLDGTGKTRVRERYQVIAPLSGQMARIELHPGDRVAAGATVAQIDPSAAPLLDVRSRAEAESRVRAAQASVDRAQAAMETARAASEFSRKELDRRRELVAKGAAARAELDAAELDERTKARQLEAAQFAVSTERFQLESAKATLLASRGESVGRGAHVPVRAPVAGSVLRVLREDAGVVAAGTPLVEIGELGTLELVVDLLSTDAVQVQAGQEAIVEQWGGKGALAARVRRVEPSAFTKISALGVEEQRVNVVLDFTGNGADAASLGDGFQVEVRIVTWSSPSVLRIPASALFRTGEAWAVYVIEGGRAHRRKVEIGHREGFQAEVASGLAEGDRVIAHPGDKLDDGALVEAAPPG